MYARLLGWDLKKSLTAERARIVEDRGRPKGGPVPWNRGSSISSRCCTLNVRWKLNGRGMLKIAQASSADTGETEQEEEREEEAPCRSLNLKRFRMYDNSHKKLPFQS